MKKFLTFSIFIFFASNIFAWSVYFNFPPSSGALKNSLLNLLSKAHVSVDIAIYNIDDEEVINVLRERQSAGVRVRIVMEGRNYLSKMALLKGLNVVADPIDNGLMHEKFVVVDDEWVWVGSANFTLSSFEKDLNNAIILHSAQLAKVFEKEFELLYDGYFSRAIRSEFLNVEGMGIFVGFSPGAKCFDELLNVLKSSKRNVYIAMYAFSDWRLALTLAWLDARGVKIHILVDPRWNVSSYSVLREMRKEFNFKTCENPYGLLHDKYIIVDPNSNNAALIMGSYNLTKSAQLRNDEVVLVIRSEKLAKLYLQNFTVIRSLSQK